MEGHCNTANAALKNALQRVKQTKPLRIGTRSRIKDSPHYKALDAVTRDVAELNKELSIIMERTVSDSDSDSDGDGDEEEDDDEEDDDDDDGLDD
jgi:hypothetical protein